MENFETMDLVLSISGALIAVMLGVIGYFLRQFSSTVTELKKAVDQLKIVVSVEQERLKNTKEILSSTATVIESRVSSLENIVDKHDRDITILKTIHNKE